MAYRIRYLPKAVRQLDEILSYIATHNRSAAHRVAGTIRRSIERLAEFPYSSRASEVPGVRELPIVRYPYIVFYSVNDETREIHVLRVCHTAQDPARHLSP